MTGKPGEPLSSIRRTRPRPGPALALTTGWEAGFPRRWSAHRPRERL